MATARNFDVMARKHIVVGIYIGGNYALHQCIIIHL